MAAAPYIVNCRVPDEPMSGTILDYNNIVTIEGSVISFQCNPGLSPEGEMTAICTNAGIWSPDPAGVVCSCSEFLISCTNQFTVHCSSFLFGVKNLIEALEVHCHGFRKTTRGRVIVLSVGLSVCLSVSLVCLFVCTKSGL